MNLRRRLEILEKQSTEVAAPAWKEFQLAERRSMARARLCLAKALGIEPDKDTTEILVGDSKHQQTIDRDIPQRWLTAHNIPIDRSDHRQEMIDRLSLMAERTMLGQGLSNT